MPETIGALIIASAASAGATGVAGFSLASTTIFGVGIAPIVGSAAIIGASIGLQYALKPDVPKPEAGSQPLKQGIPPRLMGYGRNRLAGYFMLFEAFGSYSVDVYALHHGRVGAIQYFYFHDDEVTTDPSTGAILGWGVRYQTATIGYRLGNITEVPYSGFIGISGGLWTAEHRGDGIASMAITCSSTGDPKDFTRRYPRGPVSSAASAVVDCAPIFNPWDPAQSRVNPATWQVSYSPVLQLIDYLTREDGGLGLDYDVLFPPVRLLQWYEEFALCGALVPRADGSFEPRYTSNGWFTFDTKPEDVINQILSTCDGWLCEAGDGTFALKVGVYREPTVTIEAKHFLPGFSLSYGQPDESLVNQLDVSFTDPAQKYVEVQPEPYRDEESISEAGIVRAQQLSLKWCQSQGQAMRLADRAMQRLNPEMTGTFTTDLIGLCAVGERWVRVRYPYVSGLQDAVVEIQGSEIDLLGGKVTFQFNRIDVSAIEAYDPEADEGAPVVVPDAPQRFPITADQSIGVRQAATATRA